MLKGGVGSIQPVWGKVGELDSDLKGGVEWGYLDYGSLFMQTKGTQKF